MTGLKTLVAGRSDIDNLGTCALRRRQSQNRELFRQCFKSGCAEWRCANSCRQNGLSATWWGFRVKQLLMLQWHPPVPQSGLAAIHLAECELKAEPEREAICMGPTVFDPIICRAKPLVATPRSSSPNGPRPNTMPAEWQAGMQALLLVADHEGQRYSPGSAWSGRCKGISRSRRS